MRITTNDSKTQIFKINKVTHKYLYHIVDIRIKARIIHDSSGIHIVCSSESTRISEYLRNQFRSICMSLRAGI